MEEIGKRERERGRGGRESLHQWNVSIGSVVIEISIVVHSDIVPIDFPCGSFYLDH